MSKTAKKFWLKKRNNPQLGVYYIKLGQLSEREAKQHAASIYGHNEVIAFNTEKEYLDKIEELGESAK